MIINLHKDMSPQTAAIYQLLLKPEPMTAAKIGKALQIYPHGVYRAMETLEEMGLIKKSEDYPVVYYAKPLEDALSFYLNNSCYALDR